MNKNANMQPVVKRNVILIGTYLSQKAAEYLYKVHGKSAKITVMSPKSEEFVSSEGLRKLIATTDKQVYIAGVISDRNVSFAKESGLQFTELRQDAHENVVGHWFNFGPEQKTIEVSSDEEIESLLTGRELAASTR